MEKLLELKALIEHLSHGMSNNKKINNSMSIIDDDLKTSLETLKIVPNYEDEEEVYNAVRTGAMSYLEGGVNYQSFINTLALIKKHLLLLQDNGSDKYIDRMSFELARIFIRLHINPQKKISELLRTKRITNIVNRTIPYLLGLVTGFGIGIVCRY